MIEIQRSVLFVGFSSEAFAELSAELSSRGFFADWVESCADGLDLVEMLPFDAVVVAHPLPDLPTRVLLKAARREESPSRGAGIVVVTTPELAPEVPTLQQLGANVVLFRDDAPRQITRALKELTHVAPRFPVRLVCRVRATLGKVAVQSLCQTENVSATGMLLRGDQVIPVGTEISFELQLAGDAKPVRGLAMVVRHTFERKERVSGLGARFWSFDESDRVRLVSYLDGLG